ncbi:MFS general substrate transporter [Microthyrium microscopicum]|uniref:MFS general substrate transporter n=1 Tax=Microthyrium microscopicum TaxID=703497 RepID=A0A6A6UAD8_9PEZI|nr:MFS general substrate transporter [Microthyrium microscopicum]
MSESFSLPQEIAFVAVVCLAQLYTQIGLWQALVITHTLGDSLKINNPGTLSWLIAGYSLTVGTFILFAGRLGDLFGHKRLLLIGFLWLALWSLVAGLSVYSNYVLFIFARVLQGIGSALMMPNGIAVLGVAYQPGKRKNLAFAAFAACAPIGGALGAVFSALLALAWWPWSFYVFAIALVATAILGYFVIPDPLLAGNARKLSLRATITELDLPGATVGIASLVLINFAFNQAPIVGWSEPYVYVTLIIGVLLVPLFFYIELRLSPAPLIPFAVVKAEVAFVLAATACGWAAFGGWVFYLVQFWQVLRGVSPLLTGAMISPVIVSGSLAALVTGLLLHRIGPSWIMMIAMVCFTLGNVLIAIAPVDQTYWGLTFVATLVAPFGMDMSFPAATVILSNAVGKKHQGIAGSLVATVVNYSISLGLGFAGTAEVHVNNGGKTPEDLLKGYRGAEYVGIGLAALGLCISIIFLLKERQGSKKVS